MGDSNRQTTDSAIREPRVWSRRIENRSAGIHVAFDPSGAFAFGGSPDPWADAYGELLSPRRGCWLKPR